MNIIEIAGRLGADPETRFTPNNQKVTTLRVAANNYRGGKEETVWWRVTIWGERFDRMMPYLKKGSAVIVIGEMHKPEIWTNREGEPQVSMEMTAEMIKFSPFGKSDQGEVGQQGNQEASSGFSSPAANQGFSSYEQPAPAAMQQDAGNEDDGLPF